MSDKKNYRSMYNKPETESTIPEVTSIVQVEPVGELFDEIPSEVVELFGPLEVVESTPAFGYVCDCFKLNVREAPSRDAGILCTLDAGDEIEIDESASTEEFYKVCTAAGREGYCMKNYIMIE